MYNTLENVHLLDIFQIPGAVSGGVERHPRHPPAYGPAPIVHGSGGRTWSMYYIYICVCVCDITSAVVHVSGGRTWSMYYIYVCVI